VIPVEFQVQSTESPVAMLVVAGKNDSTLPFATPTETVRANPVREQPKTVRAALKSITLNKLRITFIMVHPVCSVCFWPEKLAKPNGRAPTVTAENVLSENFTPINR
jgi:hypothetical protein